MAQAFATVAAQAMAAAASPEPSTKGLTGSVEHKRAFLQTFRRWSLLFKRKDGNTEDDKWLIAEYYKSLGHLSEAGFEKLTDRLAASHTFFPTIKECLEAIKPAGPYDWGHPFLDKPQMFAATVQRLGGPDAVKMIGGR